MIQSAWRRVRARVHLSLTPFELSNPVRSATKKAFSSLLMRYSPELGGAVVAHIGPVELCGNPAFIDASPFAHVAAVANLLVFAPKKGTELVGVVTHVGPDHLGLSVLSAFHAVLSIDGLVDVYRFYTTHNDATSSPAWERIDGSDHITIHRQLRFVISELKPTRTGLFQIIASLDPNLRQNPNDSHPLGLLPPDMEIDLSSQSLQQDSDAVETENTDVLQVAKRSSSAHANDGLRGNELLAEGNDVLGDALMPTNTPVSALKKKKPRRDEEESRGVTFEESEGQRQDRRGQLEQPQTRDTAVHATEINGGDVIDRNAIKSGENAEKSDRKKRKKDKKKKKKKSISGDEISKSLPSATKQEARTTAHGFVGQEPVASSRKGETRKDRKHGKKDKKKRKESGEPSNTEERVEGAREAAVVVKMEDTREHSMLRDAEKAVELGPMEDEDKKKRRKKKRRRSSEGETEEHKSSRRKKKKKRLSEAIKMERRRSLQ